MDSQLKGIELTVFMSAVFAIVLGALLTFIPIHIRSKKKKHCTERVLAKCIQLATTDDIIFTEPTDVDDPNEGVMKATYTAELYGQPIKIQGNAYTQPHPLIGDTRELLVNPDNVNEYIDPSKSNILYYACILMGIVVMLAGILDLFISLTVFTEFKDAEIVEVIEN